MSSVVKDNHILTSIPDTTATPVAGSTAASAESSSRPQPVALEVPVTVNGARAVLGRDKREPFSESTKTVLVYGHGAIVRLSSSVGPGQLLFLTNDKTKKEVVCQVVKSKNQHSSGYVELEFTEPLPGFWGMRFPTTATATPVQHPAPATPPSAAPSSISAPSPVKDSKSALDEILPPVSVRSELPKSVIPAPHPTPIQPASPSVPQATASSIASPATPSKDSNTPEDDRLFNGLDISKALGTITQAPAVPTRNSSPSSKSILDSEEVKIPSWLEPLARNAAIASAALPEISAPASSVHAAAKPFAENYGDAVEVEDPEVTEFTETPVAAKDPLPPAAFGTQFLADEQDSRSGKSAAQSGKKIFIAAMAAVLLSLGAGTLWYLRQPSATSSEVASTAAPTNTQNAAASTTPDSGNVAPSQSRTSKTAPSATYSSVSTPASTALPSANLNTANSANPVNPDSNPNKKVATVDAAIPEAAAAQPKRSAIGSVRLSAPVVKKSLEPQENNEEGLNLEATNQSGPAAGLAFGIGSKQPAVPSAPTSYNPSVPADIKPAKLLSTVAPVYPAFAKTQRISGNVTIDALVDATGHVSTMKFISGPAILEQAAMDALHRWLYQPAQLHGQSVPMHVTVTIQFKLP
jgi:TonB family protein